MQCFRQGQDGRCKEHAFVVRMSRQEQDISVRQKREVLLLWASEEYVDEQRDDQEYMPQPRYVEHQDRFGCIVVAESKQEEGASSLKASPRVRASGVARVQLALLLARPLKASGSSCCTRVTRLDHRVQLDRALIHMICRRIQRYRTPDRSTAVICQACYGLPPPMPRSRKTL